jgi:hypothetical protein
VDQIASARSWSAAVLCRFPRTKIEMLLHEEKGISSNTRDLPARVFALALGEDWA